MDLLVTFLFIIVTGLAAVFAGCIAAVMISAAVTTIRKQKGGTGHDHEPR